MNTLELGKFMSRTLDESILDEGDRETKHLCLHFLKLFLDYKSFKNVEVDRCLLTRENMRAYFNKDFAEIREVIKEQKPITVGDELRMLKEDYRLIQEGKRSKFHNIEENLLGRIADYEKKDPNEVLEDQATEVLKLERTESYFVFYSGDRIIGSMPFPQNYHQKAIEWFADRSGTKRRFAVKYEGIYGQKRDCEMDCNIENDNLILIKYSAEN